MCVSKQGYNVFLNYLFQNMMPSTLKLPDSKHWYRVFSNCMLQNPGANNSLIGHFNTPVKGILKLLASKHSYNTIFSNSLLQNSSGPTNWCVPWTVDGMTNQGSKGCRPSQANNFQNWCFWPQCLVHWTRAAVLCWLALVGSISDRAGYQVIVSMAPSPSGTTCCASRHPSWFMT